MRFTWLKRSDTLRTGNQAVGEFDGGGWSAISIQPVIGASQPSTWHDLATAVYAKMGKSL
jgi:hypothetical protein